MIGIFRSLEARLAGRIPTRHRPMPNPQPVTTNREAWTPVDASGAGLALTVSDAYWTQIGGLVFVFFNLTYPATASGAVAKIGGLPVKPRTTTGQTQPFLFAQTTAALTRAYVHPTDGFIHLTDATGAADANNAGMSTKTVGGCAIYEAKDVQL